MRAVATVTAAACYSLLPHRVQPVLVLRVVHWRHLANTMERTVRLRRRRRRCGLSLPLLQQLAIRFCRMVYSRFSCSM